MFFFDQKFFQAKILFCLALYLSISLDIRLSVFLSHRRQTVDASECNDDGAPEARSVILFLFLLFRCSSQVYLSLIICYHLLLKHPIPFVRFLFPLFAIELWLVVVIVVVVFVVVVLVVLVVIIFLLKETKKKD